jgi:hypothetical protein
MSFSVRSTLREGLKTSLSVKGVSMIAVFFTLTLIQDITLSSLNLPLIGSFGLSVTGISLDVGSAGYGLLSLASAGYLVATILSLRLFLGEEFSPEMFDTQLGYEAITLFFLGLATTAAVVMGSLLLLIPGILLAVGLFFYPVFVAEGQGIESLKHSWELSHGHKTKILGLMLALLVLTVVPSFAIGQLGGRLSALLVSSFETVFGLSTLVAAFKEVKQDE